MSSTAPFMVAIAGGPAAGKKTICNVIASSLQTLHNPPNVLHLGLSDFHYELGKDAQAEETEGGVQEINWHAPGAYDFDLLTTTLTSLTSSDPDLKIPTFDRSTRTRKFSTPMTCSGQETTQIDVVLIEGEYTLWSKMVREELVSLRVFADLDADERLSRLVLRDTEEKGYPLATILDDYVKFAKPSFDEFILPTKQFADIILPRGDLNTQGIELIGLHITEALRARQNQGVMVVEKKKGPRMSAMTVVSGTETPGRSWREIPREGGSFYQIGG